MITVGINVKNRWVLSLRDDWSGADIIKRPMERLLSSLENQTRRDFKVHVLDWYSDDVNYDILLERFALDSDLTKMRGRFNRSEGKNALIEICETSHLFLIDADMVVPENLIELAYQNVEHYTFWFPRCRYESVPDGEILSGWIDNAVGNVCGEIEAFRSIGFKTGGVYEKWGNEDVNFYDRARLNPCYKILRDNVEGLIHQYHTDKERKLYDC